MSSSARRPSHSWTPLFERDPPDDDIVVDENVVTDVRVAPDPGARQHVREGPDAAAFTDSFGLQQGVRVDVDAGGAWGKRFGSRDLPE
jgi:hypothetical protein